jgi:O-antigen ligase
MRQSHVNCVRPAGLFVFGFALLICYWPGISGAGTSPRWALLAAVALPTLLVIRLRVTVLHIVGFLFVAWAAATYLWTGAPLDSIAALWKLAILASILCIGGECDDLAPFYWGAAAGLAISSLIAILQIAGYAPVPDVAHDQAIGLFVNRLVLAEAAALIGLALLAMEWWPAVVLLVAPALILPCERSPILAFCFAGAFWLWRISRLGACGLALSGILAAAAITSGLTFNEIPDAKNSQNRIETAAARLTIWRAVAEQTSPLGSGFGAFRETAPQPIAGAIIEHAHNEPIEIAFETGFVGLVLFALLFGGAIAIFPRSIEGIVLLGLLMEASFAFSFHEPTTAAMGALCAGSAARRLPRLGDAFDRCGIFLRGWLASCVRLLARDGKPDDRRGSVSVRPSVS